jgi:hypothetical protein
MLDTNSQSLWRQPNIILEGKGHYHIYFNCIKMRIDLWLVKVLIPSVAQRKDNIKPN